MGEQAGALSGWQALVLGLVQGFTELLPISSSGHLILVPWLGDWRYLEEHDQFNQTFDVALHLGTLVAVAGTSGTRSVAFTRAWFRSIASPRSRRPTSALRGAIALATVPAALAGAARRGRDRDAPRRAVADRDPARAVRRPPLDRRPDAQRPELDGLGVRSGFLGIGLAQVLALMPGVSRSGVTITAGRFLGLDRDAAARFSFLLLVPMTFGAVLYKGLNDVAARRPLRQARSAHSSSARSQPREQA